MIRDGWLPPPACLAHWEKVRHGLRIEREMKEDRCLKNPTRLMLLYPNSRNALEARLRHGRSIKPSDVRRLEQDMHYGRSR